MEADAANPMATPSPPGADKDLPLRRGDHIRHLRLRTLLVWLVMASLMPGMIGATYLFVREFGQGRKQLENDTIATARALVHAVDGELLKVKAAAQSLSGASALQRRDFAAFHRRASGMIALTKAGSNVVLSDASGQQVVNTLRSFGEPLPRHGNAEVLHRVFATGLPQISDIYIGGVLKKPVMSVDVPVIIAGKVAYDLSVGVTPGQFAHILEAQHLPPGWVAAVFDRSGTIAARTQSGDLFVGKKGTVEFIERIRQDEEGILLTHTLEGVPSLSVWSRSPQTGWSVGIGIPRSELESGLTRTLYLVAIGIASLLMLGMGLAWMAARRVSRSLGAIAAQAAALGEGQPALPPRLMVKEAAGVAQAIFHAGQLLSVRAEALQAANASLRKREYELDLAHRLAKFGDWHWNLETGAFHASESIREICGREVPPFPEQRGTLLSIGTWERVEAAMQETVRSGLGFDLELEMNHGSGEVIWVNVRCQPIRNARGEVRELLGTLVDITERKRAQLELEMARKAYRQHLEQQVSERTEALMRANVELERLARHDALTGLQNRNSANERLRQEFLRMKRTGEVYAVLFADIDHFKEINDTYGHETGDQVLVTFAETLASSIRQSDFAARFGGEEFLVLLPESDRDGALVIAEKIRQSVAERDFPVIGHLTVSIGVSLARAGDPSEDDAVRRADEALYQAKRAGRNRVSAE
jgi:diguanylate cyclase (GGDEF)-like protein